VRTIEISQRLDSRACNRKRYPPMSKKYVQGVRQFSSSTHAIIRVFFPPPHNLVETYDATMRPTLFLLSLLGAKSLPDRAVRRVLDASLERKLAVLEDDDAVSVFVGYRSKTGREQVKKFASHDILSQHDFDEVGAVAVKLPKGKLKKLAKSSEINYIEGNSRVYPLQTFSDQVPYGIIMSQASPLDVDAFRIRRSPPSCSSSDVLKVAIVDSGVAVTHPDLACYPKNESSVNCVGRTFGLSSSDDHWYDAQLAFHGTHVAGTIGALANNVGTVGMIPDNDVCYVFARVFGESGGADFSDVLDAVRWAISSDGGGATVVNLSLGNADYSKTCETLLQSIHDQGKLVLLRQW
jgi:Subtilase family